MNLLLHGLDAPNIDTGNALRFKLSEIGEKDRVDVIVTNPPFGGEEEKGIQGNFPDDRGRRRLRCCFSNSSCDVSSDMGRGELLLWFLKALCQMEE